MTLAPAYGGVVWAAQASKGSGFALSNPPTAVDSGEQFVDDLSCDLFVIKVRARYIPPSHSTV
jgi:hypothetical protein